MGGQIIYFVIRKKEVRKYGETEKAIYNFLLLKFMDEQVMTVHIELQTERRPGRDTEVSFTHIWLDMGCGTDKMEKVALERCINLSFPLKSGSAFGNAEPLKF